MTSILQVQRINASDLSIDAFVENYLIPGVPVLISASTRDWAACREWVNSDGSPNVDALASKYGASRVRATRMDFEAAYGEDDIKLMTLSEYVRWWKAREHHDGENPAWYLKDWHFASEYPSAQVCSARGQRLISTEQTSRSSRFARSLLQDVCVPALL